ncbi:hypothetical protein D3C83_96150 [compost metagenome]
MVLIITPIGWASYWNASISFLMFSCSIVCSVICVIHSCSCVSVGSSPKMIR